jgi:hypothetical protein
MAFPIGIAAGLGNLVGSGFAWLVGIYTAIVSRKVAVGAALAAFLVAGWTAIQLTLYAMWTSLGWIMPSELSIPMGFIRYLLPANTALCIEVVILAKIGRWLWDNQRDWAIATAQA